MPLSEGNLAQNVRRLAGMHLASIDKLAQFIRAQGKLKISRETLQAIVAHDPEKRSIPKVETANRNRGRLRRELEPLQRTRRVPARSGRELRARPDRGVRRGPDGGDGRAAAREEGVPVVVDMPRQKRRKKGR